MELKRGYYWHRPSKKSEWKVVRIIQRWTEWGYYWNNEYFQLLTSDYLKEIPEPPK